MTYGKAVSQDHTDSGVPCRVRKVKAVQLVNFVY